MCRGALQAKLFFEQALVSHIDTRTEISVFRKMKVDAYFVIQRLTQTLKVKVGSVILVKVPRDQLRLGFRLRTISHIAAQEIRVSSPREKIGRASCRERV